MLRPFSHYLTASSLVKRQWGLVTPLAPKPSKILVNKVIAKVSCINADSLYVKTAFTLP